MPAAVQRGFARALIAAAAAGDPSTTTPPAPAPSSAIGLGAQLPGSQGRVLFRGSWNAELYAPLAAAATAQDVVCGKNRLSGLWCADTPLWRHLTTTATTTGIKTLLFAGVNTDQCVLGTLADAYNAGWDCVLVEDCCATASPGGAGEAVVFNAAVSHAHPPIFLSRWFFIYSRCCPSSRAAVVSQEK